MTPPIQVGNGAFGFTFQHLYWLENGYDGGVIEITQDGGATWTDIGAAATPGYNGGVDGSAVSALAGRPAFTHMSPNYPNFTTVSVNLGTAYAGKTVQVRFRLGSDDALNQVGWMIDNVAFTGITNLPFRVPVADTSPCLPLAVGDEAPTELAFAVSGANPVRGDARFRFALPQASHVRIGLYDVNGRRVATLADAEFGAGTFEATWRRGGDAAVGPGVYFARMEAGGQVLRQRMVVLER